MTSLKIKIGTKRGRGDLQTFKVTRWIEGEKGLIEGGTVEMRAKSIKTLLKKAAFWSCSIIRVTDKDGNITRWECLYQGTTLRYTIELAADS